MQKEPETTIKVKESTSQALKNLKKRLAGQNLKSANDVIKWLIDQEGQEIPRAPDPEEEEDEPVRKRKKLVGDAFYSLQELTQRPKMLEYYTNLTRSQIDMLIARFETKDRPSGHFPYTLLA